jgi:arsenate reductase (glutaredoxin)
MTLQLYGIPNCGTCKKAIAWLEQHKLAYTFINTKQTPPTRAMICDWVKVLGAKALRNTSGQSYRALGEERNNWSDQDWISAYSRDAMLIKRPLWVKNGAAMMVGFRGSEDEIRETLGLQTQ